MSIDVVYIAVQAWMSRKHLFVCCRCWADSFQTLLFLISFPGSYRLGKYKEVWIQKWTSFLMRVVTSFLYVLIDWIVNNGLGNVYPVKIKTVHMDSLKVFAAKIKSSPQLIRKTFASSAYDSYAKVSSGDILKGNILWDEESKNFKFTVETCLHCRIQTIYLKTGRHLLP